MTNEKAIEILKYHKCPDGKGMDCGKYSCAEHHEAIDKAVEALTATTWIPCSEKSPEYTGEYNVTVGMSGIDGYYEETTTLPYLHTAGESRWMIPKSIDLDPFILTVIAWMPLPKPYAESVKA